jgi:transcriptional regulator with XRE-family HTH domain
MATLERPVDRGTRLARATLVRLGQELREARVERGLGQEAAARASGLSKSELSRIERGLAPWVSVVALSRAAAVVGLDLSSRLFPGGQPFRDAGQLAILEAFRSGSHPSLGWATEVPLPIPGDPRAWDGVVSGRDWAYGVEAEGLPRDAQSLQRRLHLKLRDSGLSGVLLLVRDTERNRRFIRDAADILAPDFPVPGWRAMRALEAGESPGGSAIVFIAPAPPDTRPNRRPGGQPARAQRRST